jgi:hypothetical protein
MLKNLDSDAKASFKAQVLFYAMGIFLNNLVEKDIDIETRSRLSNLILQILQLN